MPSKLPRFIDFEASGNSYTYPIEVAWSDESGNVESHLISRKSVADWREWSWSKWAIHRIWPWQLRWFGKTPAQVCARMDEALNGGKIYCDGPPWDADWLDKLYKAAGRSADHFTIVGIDKLECIGRLNDQT